MVEIYDFYTTILCLNEFSKLIAYWSQAILNQSIHCKVCADDQILYGWLRSLAPKSFAQEKKCQTSAAATQTQYWVWKHFTSFGFFSILKLVDSILRLNICKRVKHTKSFAPRRHFEYCCFELFPLDGNGMFLYPERKLFP